MAIKTAQSQRGRGWMPYALAAGFVLLASSAALPHAPASFAAVIRVLRALLS
jgi:hypothetical protein